MDDKFEIYEYNACPYCGGDLGDAGKSQSDNQIVQCIECGQIILEKDIVYLQKYLKKEKDEKD